MCKKKCKIFKFIPLLVIGCVIFSSCYVNRPLKTEDAVRTITVSGSGNVVVSPDVVSLKFLVKTTDWNVSKAVEKNATNMANVFEALKTVGIAESDISTSDYQIYQDNSKDYPGQYTVRNSIVVVIRNPELAGTVIDAAVKGNGANGLSSYSYSVTDKSSALRQARTLAIQDAQDAASLLAGASGCKVSKVLNISEDYTSTSATNEMMMAKSTALADSAPTRIEAGSVTVSSNVRITYQLEN